MDPSLIPGTQFLTHTWIYCIIVSYTYFISINWYQSLLRYKI